VNDVVFSRTDVDGDGYDDLHISFANHSGSVTILEAFRPVSWVHDRQVDWFEFSDGTVINHDDLILV
jgi:hypothetical protein